MKNLIIIALLFFSSILSANELAWVDEQIEAIKPSRSGLKNSTINSMKDPFIFLKKYKKDIAIKKSKITHKNIISSSNSIKVTPKKKLALVAVMNKSALISGSWYRLGEIVNGYKLSEINKKSVLLTKKSKTLILSTDSINKKLNFKNK